MVQPGRPAMTQTTTSSQQQGMTMQHSPQAPRVTQTQSLGEPSPTTAQPMLYYP
jgi:hypothetical protein